MPAAHTLDVETIFSTEQVSVGGGRLRVLGVLTLLIGAAWLYTTWVPMYRWINRTVAIGGFNVAMEAMSPGDKNDKTANGDLAAFMGVITGKPAATPGAQSKSSKSSKSRSSNKKPAPAPTPDPQTLAKAELAMSFLPVAGYTWLAIATFTGLWLMMGGLAAVAPGESARALGKLILIVAVLATAGLLAYSKSRWNWMELAMPDWIKPALGGLLVLFACSLGASLNRRRVWLHRAGGVLIVLSAVGSVAAIWSAVRWGQMPGEDIDLLLYTKVFALQSAYGWITLLAMIGVK